VKLEKRFLAGEQERKRNSAIARDFSRKGWRDVALGRGG